MVDGGETSDGPNGGSATAIRAAMDRILASDALRGAPQLSAFLSFIVERALAGRGGELKGYTIAVEAFGRAPDFDPQTDPIVRVEAGRLRKALALYYAGEGADDPVRITMPVGAYVPVFQSVVPAAPAEPEAPRHEPQPAAAIESAAPVAAASAAARPDYGALAGRVLLWAALGLLVGAAIFLVWRDARQALDAVRLNAPAQNGAAADGDRAETGAVNAYLPVISVSFGETPSDPGLADVARTFTRLLVDALARFDDMVSIKAPADASEAQEKPDYTFEMNLDRVGDSVEGFGRLSFVRDGRIVWTTSTMRSLAGGAEDGALQELARRLAIRLAEPFGIIHADFRQAANSPAMRCLFKALNVRRTMKADDHLAARTCLEEVVEKDPGFHPAWSQLSLLILDEYTFGLNPKSGMPLERAMAAAMTAVRLAPSSARAQQAMMDVHFARGAIEDALKAGQEATARNPYDPDIMADLGARYIQLNRPAEGLPLLERAIELSTGRPSWYDFFAFVGAHLLGASKVAEAHAAILVADESPLSLLGRSLHAAVTGDDVGAMAAMRRLAQIEPLLVVDKRLFLSRAGFSSVVIDRILVDLGPAAAITP
ncbi:hypothetical protein [Bosea sp. PAMC 26642]|uniref:hypothetical protein n=1 Tax=Bosea sp. (strain PAMC 26642) TaxID=1792307 RepID=UPI0007701592|nr:hypothetical protein [Bosea sp. PAMC 26642]AMJ58912.1 hypothetical protein AXW83_00090 [Bosea sp. PAMC 26642]